MRYGIFSDVHANLQAFRAALTWYKQQEIDRYIFLGDIVGYGAHPRETIALLQTLDAVCVCGNHDWACITKADSSRFNPFAQAALIWTKDILTDNEKRVLSCFDLTHQGDNFICVHGSVFEPEQFHYILDARDAHSNFRSMEHHICFVGHSHRQEAFILKKDGVLTHTHATAIALDENEQYIVNVGSVGQPRDRDPRGCACVYDTEGKSITMHRFEYDIKAAYDAIVQHNLPSFLAERLLRGQ